MVDGAAEHEGRLEIYFQGQWGTVCDDNWDQFSDEAQRFQNADVACQELGYLGAAAVDVDVPDGVDPIWLDDRQ